MVPLSAEISDNPTLGSSSPLSPVSEFESCFIKEVFIGKEIGAGAFGTVYEGTWHGAKVAVKSLYNHNLLEFSREALTMKKLSHPNIVQFMGIYKDERDEKSMYMVTEFVDGGNLETMLRDNPDFFSNDDLLRITMEVVSGMRLLEQKGIIHRDLAARNILIDTSKQDLVAKVADFGMSRDTLQYYTASSPILFPIKWAPPEVIKFNKYSLKSDIWAMGVTMWEIFSYGEIPYRGMTNKEAAEWVCSGNRLPLPPSLSPQLSSIITSCWHQNAQSRPTFKEIYDELEYIQNPKKREMEAEREALANLPRDANNYILDNQQGVDESEDDISESAPFFDAIPAPPTLETVPPPILPLNLNNNNNNNNNNSSNFDHLDFNHVNALNSLNVLRNFDNSFYPHSDLPTSNKLHIINHFTNSTSPIIAHQSNNNNSPSRSPLMTSSPNNNKAKTRNNNRNKSEYEQLARNQRGEDSINNSNNSNNTTNHNNGNTNNTNNATSNNNTTNHNKDTINNNNNNYDEFPESSESRYQDGSALINDDDTPN